MLKLLVSLLALSFVTDAEAASSPPAPILPTLSDCVRADTVVCKFRLVRAADLTVGNAVVLGVPSGLPKVDHVELRRIDDGLLLLVEYFAPDPALQGVAF